MDKLMADNKFCEQFNEKYKDLCHTTKRVKKRQRKRKKEKKFSSMMKSRIKEDKNFLSKLANA